MKKYLFLLLMLLTFSGFNRVYSQTGYNAVLEYCTGTWCQYCPCAEDIIHGILQNYPNTLILGYHGPTGSSDPWSSYSAGIIGQLGMGASWPMGVVSRRTGAVDRGQWNNRIVIQSNTIQPGVSITFDKSYNSSTREMSVTAHVTAQSNLTGNYFINFILTENNLIYSQTGNSGCIGSSAYEHDFVVKGMLNGDLGEALNSGGSWAQGTTINKSITYTIPAGLVAENCEINSLVYLSSGGLATDSYVQQTKHEAITTATGVINQNGIIPEKYTLDQNYPNPFNPTTNIKFSVPKDGNVSLKFYDILGNEVSTYVNGFLKAGVYNAEFDGTSLSSGIYFYTLKTNDFVETRKMILNK